MSMIPFNPVIYNFFELHAKMNRSPRTVPFEEVAMSFRAMQGLSSCKDDFEYHGKDFKVVISNIRDFLAVYAAEKGVDLIRRDDKYFFVTHATSEKGSTLLLFVSIFTYSSSSASVVISGDVEETKNLKELLMERFFCKTIKIRETIVSNDEIRSNSTTIELSDSRSVAPRVNYPFLSRSAEELSKVFNESTNNLIMLIGPPGTGKSTYLRAMAYALSELERKIYVISSDRVVNHPNFEKWIGLTSRNSVIIIEDADLLVGKRSNGNQVMSMLLNQLDGIVPVERKFIISTNISSINKVDEALVRPGRCFDILKFRKLTGDEAINLHRLAETGVDTSMFEGRDEVSLAEALNATPEISTNERKSTFGFNAS